MLRGGCTERTMTVWIQARVVRQDRSHDECAAVSTACPESVVLESARPDAGILGTVAKSVYLGSHMEYSVETELGDLFGFSTAPTLRCYAGPRSP